MVLNDFQITRQSSIIEALKKIDNNKKGFLIVMDGLKVVGVLTDGDLRRAIIKGKNVTDSIQGVYKKDFSSLNVRDNPYLVIDIFKNEAINFLPIVDDDFKLVNIITKKNMHSLLLQDIEFTLQDNFLDIDDSLIEHEINQRPWGFFKTSILNSYFQSKIIKLHPNSSISLQTHNEREEHWVVVHGQGKVQIGESIKPVAAGSYLFIPKACKHRIVNTSEMDSLVISEVQIGTYYGEDDIVRYEDEYGRI